jgi:hypothetical protein
VLAGSAAVEFMVAVADGGGMTAGGGVAAMAMTGAATFTLMVLGEPPVGARRMAAGAAMAAEAGGKLRITSKFHHNTPSNSTPMKYSNQLRLFPGLLTFAFLAAAFGALPATLYAVEPESAPAAPTVAERLFASPEEAIKALRAATEAKDQTALQEIFGPEYQELKTGDKVQDANNAQRFAASMAQSCNQAKESDEKITLEVGTNDWPMPIPLVKADGQWHFDTAAGKEEIINRHIGKDELCAIGVCRAYVTAQRQYASANPAAGGTVNYAQKFKSSAGKKDGLYWPAVGDETASPFGPLVAEAHAEGYIHKGSGQHPFHGYYFRILTRQGEAAPGGTMDYLSHGSLTGGFALVAYPEHWDQSGIMTFIVNQDGKVFQRNLGEKNSRIARAMKEYNPDSDWTLVQDDGVTNVVSEK